MAISTLDAALAATDDLDQRLLQIRAAVSGRIAFATSLQKEDQAILDAIARTGIDVDVFTLDTGRLFPEIYETIERTEARYGLRIRIAASAWITGIRRDQTETRADVAFAAFDAADGLPKLNPIADWSLLRLDAYLGDHDVPINPMQARGFPSVGCQPCTRRVEPGEDIRAGRWWWERDDHKECGLHWAVEPDDPTVDRPAIDGAERVAA